MMQVDSVGAVVDDELRNLWALGSRLVTVPTLEKEIRSEEEVAKDLKVTKQKLETNRNNLISDRS